MSSTLYTLPGRTPESSSLGERSFRWLTAHRAQVALVIGMAALVALFSILIVVNRRRLADRGSDQLSMARMQLAAGKRKEALQILDDIVRSQRASAVALQAYVMKGEALMAEGKFSEASDLYEEAFLRATNVAYKPLFLAGMASASVELNMFAEAAGHYRTFLNDYPDHFLVPRVYLELGRLRLELKEPEEARKAFEKLVTLFPKSPWVAEAQSYLAGLPAPAPVNPAVEKK